MQTITSKDNELIKHIRKLKDKKYRDESNEYVVEGVKLVEEAVKENAKIKQIIVCEDTTRTYEIPTHIMLEIAKYECISVSDKIFNIITQVTNPQGIMAIIEKNTQNAQIDYTQDIIVVLDDVQGQVTFENVCFGYDPSKIVINDFSMYIKPGQTTAIVGPTGAGKTTIVKLLMRFYELNSGAIYIDGHNITDYTRSGLRNMVGMV